MQRLDVLPLLLAVVRKGFDQRLPRYCCDKHLQQRDQEVDGQHDVLHNFVLGHGDVTNGDGQTQDLLQLELDGGSDFVGLLGEVFRVRDGGREFTGCGRFRYQTTLPTANSFRGTYPWKDRDPTDEESA